MVKAKRIAGTSEEQLFSEGYDRACQLLYACSLPDGFLATPTEETNYRRIWARDGVIIGLRNMSMKMRHSLVEITL